MYSGIVLAPFLQITGLGVPAGKRTGRPLLTSAVGVFSSGRRFDVLMEHVGRCASNDVGAPERGLVDLQHVHGSLHYLGKHTSTTAKRSLHMLLTVH